MANKLISIIEGLDYDDLLKIKKDLEEGNIRRLINQRIGELNDENKVCPVCGKDVKSNDYKLEFGELGLRMKASFDGLDCLQHFIKRLEKKSSESSPS